MTTNREKQQTQVQFKASDCQSPITQAILNVNIIATKLMFLLQLALNRPFSLSGRTY